MLGCPPLCRWCHACRFGLRPAAQAWRHLCSPRPKRGRSYEVHPAPTSSTTGEDEKPAPPAESPAKLYQGLHRLGEQVERETVRQRLPYRYLAVTRPPELVEEAPKLTGTPRHAPTRTVTHRCTPARNVAQCCTMLHTVTHRHALTPQELVEEAQKLELLWARMEMFDPDVGEELVGAEPSRSTVT